MPQKNARQCKDRWFHYLCPGLNNQSWTAEEDRLLLEKQSELGQKWVAIARFFPHRTDLMIKNRFQQLRRRARKVSELFEHGQLIALRLLERMEQPWSRTGEQEETDRQANSGDDVSLDIWTETNEFMDDMYEL
jgi:hypothetical protein